MIFESTCLLVYQYVDEHTSHALYFHIVISDLIDVTVLSDCAHFRLFVLVVWVDVYFHVVNTE